MPVIVCAMTPTSGVRHRFIALRQAKSFADRFGYRVVWLWGMTRGVAFCRYDELFAPVPGVEVHSLPAETYRYAATSDISASHVAFRGKTYPVLKPDTQPTGKDFFCWDLVSSGALARMLPEPTPPLFAKFAPQLQAEIDSHVKANGIGSRLGIRVRVSELLSQQRKPHRVKSELDEVLRSLYKLPWNTRVFLATDSEYIHQALASRFLDLRCISKKYDLRESTGRYVHRQDKQAMFTFLKEVGCLCACDQIINMGGFLNDGSVRPRIIDAPYRESAHSHSVRV